jgi:hypothetical protein
LLAGRSDEGERHARRALARAGGLEAIRPAILAVLAWALLERNQVPEAVTLVEEAQALVDAEGRPEVNESLLQWVRARALATAGDQPRADEASRAARSRLEWRAAQIADPVIRDRFLQLPHSRHILALVAAPG